MPFYTRRKDMKRVVYAVAGVSLLYAAVSFCSDDYSVKINNTTGLPIFYSFRKTASGKVIPKAGIVSKELDPGVETVNPQDFSVLKRSKYTSEQTTLFVSLLKPSLDAVINGHQTKPNKKYVASYSIPYKTSHSCGGSVMFTVRRKDLNPDSTDPELIVTVQDERTCL